MAPILTPPPSPRNETTERKQETGNVPTVPSNGQCFQMTPINGILNKALDIEAGDLGDSDPQDDVLDGRQISDSRSERDIRLEDIVGDDSDGSIDVVVLKGSLTDDIHAECCTETTESIQISLTETNTEEVVENVAAVEGEEKTEHCVAFNGLTDDEHDHDHDHDDDDERTDFRKCIEFELKVRRGIDLDGSSSEQQMKIETDKFTTEPISKPGEIYRISV